MGIRPRTAPGLRHADHDHSTDVRPTQPYFAPREPGFEAEITCPWTHNHDRIGCAPGRPAGSRRRRRSALARAAPAPGPRWRPRRLPPLGRRARARLAPQPHMAPAAPASGPGSCRVPRPPGAVAPPLVRHHGPGTRSHPGRRHMPLAGRPPRRWGGGSACVAPRRRGRLPPPVRGAARGALSPATRHVGPPVGTPPEIRENKATHTRGSPVTSTPPAPQETHAINENAPRPRKHGRPRRKAGIHHHALVTNATAHPTNHQDPITNPSKPVDNMFKTCR